LPWSIASNSANVIFSQLTFFGSVFVLFLNELGLSKTLIGSILSLIPFFSAIALFVAPAVARFGYKRTYLAFFGGRKFVAALLLLTPWVLSTFGAQAVLWYLVGVIAVFALFRSIAFTAYYPWKQEFVPDAVRGKYAAIRRIFTSVTGFVAVLGAGYVLGASPDLDQFILLFAIGLFFGLITVWTAVYIPGGASVEETQDEQPTHKDMLAVLKDSSFVRYIVAAGLVILILRALSTFLPLFMKEEVGLGSGNVVLLQASTMIGGLLFSYVWGWAADRYGSKPVTLVGVYLLMLLPLGWMAMPRQTSWSLYVALAIAFVQGVAKLGWFIGSARFLFGSVVPTEKKTEYMALYYALVGVISGFSRLAGGRVVDASAGFSGEFLVFTLDPYTVLFVAGLVLPLVSLWLLRGVRSDSALGTREFAGMFLQGNPLQAAESLIRYRFAKDERDTISTTELMGEAKSPLAVEELLESLSDPRFFVRFEAIVSIARMEPDPRLTEALAKVLRGSEPALSVIAAWALGRIGDRRALEPLREGLNAPYRSIQAHSARSLGSLGDREVIPLMLERLEQTSDHGLQMAYASALGKMQVEQAANSLLALLRAGPNGESRMELALALARLVGEEHHFIKLARQLGEETGTATALAVTDLQKKVAELDRDGNGLSEEMDACADALAREDLEHGIARMSQAIRLLPERDFCETCLTILHECADQMERFGPERIEYTLLALHTLMVVNKEAESLVPVL
jgi:MFS family permease